MGPPKMKQFLFKDPQIWILGGGHPILELLIFKRFINIFNKKWYQCTQNDLINELDPKKYWKDENCALYGLTLVMYPYE